MHKVRAIRKRSKAGEATTMQNYGRGPEGWVGNKSGDVGDSKCQYPLSKLMLVAMYKKN